MAETSFKETLTETYAADIANRFGPAAPRILAFLRSLPDPSGAADILRNSAEGQELVARLEGCAPWVLASVTPYPDLTEQILTGHLSEPSEDPIGSLPLDALPGAVAREFLRTRVARLAHWAAHCGEAGVELNSLVESLLSHIHRRLQLSFSVISLGSLAMMDLAPSSNINVLLLASGSEGPRNDLETHALFGFFEGLRHYGVDVDLAIQRIYGRLYMNPGGLSGLQVSTLSPAEFVALSVSRTLIGEAERTVEPTPMTPQRLRTLLAYKKKLETELVPIRYRRRNVKFGEGGLSDIEWLLMLHEARYPTATDRTRPFPGEKGPAEAWRTPERLSRLSTAHLLTPMEKEALLAAYHHFTEVRTRLYLLNFHTDVVPENPDKLDRLAGCMGAEEGNEFLRDHEAHRDAVRGIFVDSMERLHA